MSKSRISVSGLIALVLLVAAPGARAQWAVIDVSSIAQLMQQVQILDQALNTARGQLAQAQQEYQSIIGTRGMQNLLSGTVRNYLPSNTTDLMAALSQVNSGYSGLSASMQTAMRTNALLTPQQLAALPPTEQ